MTRILELIVIGVLATFAVIAMTSKTIAAVCLPSAKAVREAGGYPMYSHHLAGHKGHKCWYPERKDEVVAKPTFVEKIKSAVTAAVQAPPEVSSKIVEDDVNDVSARKKKSREIKVVRNQAATTLSDIDPVPVESAAVVRNPDITPGVLAVMLEDSVWSRWDASWSDLYDRRSGLRNK